jgi:hypothetical protein
MRPLTILGMAICAAVVMGQGAGYTGSLGQAPPPPKADMGFAEVPLTPRPDREVNRPTNEALDKEIAKIELDGVPLEEAVKILRQEARVDIFVNWKALESADVKRDTRVAVKLAKVPARKALDTILSQVDSGKGALHFVVQDNMVVVSTMDDLSSEKYQAVIVYDLRSLFVDMEFDSPQAMEIASNIIDSMQIVVAQNTWRNQGGTIGSARMLSGQLIVNQTLENQDKIEEFLKEMTAGTPRTTRSYDVRDLIGAEAASRPSTMPAFGSDKVKALIVAIEANCGRDTWREMGGKTSSVAYFDGKLFITTRPSIHDQIARFLALMRK